MINQIEALTPDWISPPGDTILDYIEERDWTQKKLSQRLGCSDKHINQLISGKSPITDDMAFKLERVVGGSSGFWMSREAKYRESLAKIDATEKYKSWVDWLKVLPMTDLKAAKVIPDERITAANKPQLVEILLRFFGVASPTEWEKTYLNMELSFRRTKEKQSDNGAITSWLRLGEIQAEKISTPKYNASTFREALKEIRALTTLEPEQFEPMLRKLCSQSGVKLAFVPSISKAHVSGVARWLNPHSPLIQISLYGKTNDKLWFTFFHEAAHILLHSDKKKDIFLDVQSGADMNSPEEDEANNWAADYLIPAEYKDELRDLAFTSNRNSVTSFAEKVGIHPGVVVGRLQHEGLLEYNSALTYLKDSYQFTS